jgi:putative flavoprotein involved in K+ transport
MSESGNESSVHAEALIEAGAAFRERAGLQAPERFDVVVIGAGQAGLSVGYHLARRGVRFVILDAETRIGDVWRKRWDSLRLFTPARFDALDGMRFPAPGDHFPTKDEMADYLEAYAKRFALPVRHGTRVERLFARDGRYVLQAGGREIEADQVVVAMASYQRPRVPEFAAQLSPDVNQLHSSRYRGPDSMRAGDVLLVGAGNSGAEIAVELARRGHRVLLSGRDVGHVPFRIGGWLGLRIAGPIVLRFVFHRLLTVRTRLGRKARLLHEGAPLIRTRPKELAAAGVARVTRVTGVRDGRPLLADGRVLDVRNVVWCTGFDAGMAWIDLPIFDDHGEPRHEEGVVKDAPGLYFVGLQFLFAMSSTMIHGVGRDAARIASAVAARVRSR